jgi:hypothetical protein
VGADVRFFQVIQVLLYQRRTSVAATVLMVLAASAPMVLPAAPATAAAMCQDRQPDSRSAQSMARNCRRPVEDVSRRAEDSQTIINPDGSRNLVEYAKPQWVRRPDRSWVPVDTTLRRVIGAVQPGATIVPVTLSAGGRAALARLASGDRALALFWPTALPAPVLQGDTAVYPDVYPDVDLRVTANEYGFTKLLVVKTRAAARNPALGRITFGLSTRGLSVSAAADGGAVARDPTGAVVFESPRPMMWDSSGDSAAAAPRMAPVAEQVGAASLTIVPDAGMLADPNAKLPIYIDPGWTGGISSNVWKVIASRSDVADSSTFTLVNGATAGNAGSGRICDVVSDGVCQSTTYVVRTMFRMAMGGATGRHVLRATFNITQKWAWTCSPASSAKLWMTGGISASTSWNTQPSWDSAHTATAAANHKYTGTTSCSGTGNVAFDATGMVVHAQSQGWSSITLGLRAVDESTVNQWKRFDAGTASLVITFNSYPNVPDTLSTQGQGCVTGSGRPVVATATATLSARVTDPDGSNEGDINGTLRGNYSWEQWNPTTNTWSVLGTGVGTPQAGGTTTPSPAPSFANGGIFRWHVRAANAWSLSGAGSGTDYSTWTGYCEFEVDTTRPNTAVVTPDSGNAPFAAGKTVRLSLAPGGTPPDTDITGYSWWVVDGAGTHPVNLASGPTATIDWTPIAGQATVFVQAKDRVQGSVTNATYVFNAAQQATEVARWPLSEPPGATSAGDVTGNGNDAAATLTGASTFAAPSRTVNGASALSLDGGAGNTVATPAAVLDTSKSFTVSVYVKLATKSGDQIAASQGGAASGFTLGYAAGAGEDRWELITMNPSGTVTGRAKSSLAPVVGVWTLITGVYDSATRTTTIYINGSPQGTATGITNWNATGMFRIGRGSTQQFVGGIADVRAWNRVLSNAEIRDIADPTHADNVASDNVGRWLIEPATCFGDPVTCQDSSAYAHDLNLSGGVVLTTAGQAGSGLAYAGTDGVAQTVDPNTGELGPALHTDQSFTVSAWVNLAAVPDRPYTALGQSGTQISGFFLGARPTGTAPATPKWTFAMKHTGADTGTEWTIVASSAAITAADVGTWVHLVATFDASTGAMALYVNGALAGTATRTAAPWDANGPFTIGSAQFTPTGGTPGLTDRWNGRIDTVTAYVGAVPAASITRIP